MRRTPIIVFLLFPLLLSAVRAEEKVSYVRDVMPVLSRGGCNTGGCHGHRDGRGSFKLSLWGDWPETDHESLTKDERRINLKSPEASRILQKPTLEADHEGGKRFSMESPEYDILLRWVQQGAQSDHDKPPVLTSLVVTPESLVISEPGKEVQLNVKATFDDGVERDVTYWAVYDLSNLVAEVGTEGKVTFLKPGETTVLVRYLDKRVSARLALVPNRPDFTWKSPPVVNYIDELVFAKQRAMRIQPAEPCDDATFIRRVYLDVIGTLPTAEEAQEFVHDSDADKRNKLIEQLLKRPEFADFWALKWSDLLRNEEKVLDSKGVETFHEWLRKEIKDGIGLDELTRELLTARGSTYENPPANYYRALRQPVDRAEATAQVFLGARLRCAKCHNHPFDRWTQDEYYQFAALFDGIDYEIVENKRRDKFDKNQFIGEQKIKLVAKREFKDPRTKEPPEPRLLGSETPALDEKRDRFEQLAEWITAPENAQFSQVQANRIWYNLMGRGLVEPIDDFRPTNPPSHPDLLKALAQDLRDHKYDLRHLIRRIVSSQAYQLSSTPNATNQDDDLNYGRAPTPRHSAEVLLDAVHDALGVPPKFKHYKKAPSAIALPGIKGAHLDKKPHHNDRFLRLFGKPPRLINSDAERLKETTLAQVFELTSGSLVDSLLESKRNRLTELLKRESDVEILSGLYWSTVSRPPTEAESARMLPYLDRPNADEKRRALQDIAWALLNSKEFLFRH